MAKGRLTGSKLKTTANSTYDIPNVTIHRIEVGADGIADVYLWFEVVLRLSGGGGVGGRGLRTYIPDYQTIEPDEAKKLLGSRKLVNLAWRRALAHGRSLKSKEGTARWAQSVSQRFTMETTLLERALMTTYTQSITKYASHTEQTIKDAGSDIARGLLESMQSNLASAKAISDLSKSRLMLTLEADTIEKGSEELRQVQVSGKTSRIRVGVKARMSAYGFIRDFGRGPGPVNVDVIRKWAERYDIQPYGDITFDAMVWLITKKITKEGYQGNDWFYHALKDTVDKGLPEYYLRLSMRTTSEKEIRKALRISKRKYEGWSRSYRGLEVKIS